MCNLQHIFLGHDRHNCMFIFYYFIRRCIVGSLPKFQQKVRDGNRNEWIEKKVSLLLSLEWGILEWYDQLLKEDKTNKQQQLKRRFIKPHTFILESLLFISASKFYQPFLFFILFLCWIHRRPKWLDDINLDAIFWPVQKSESKQIEMYS